MTKVVKPKKEKVATVKKATNLVQRATGGSLAQQLRLLGLRVVTIQADGNCLFRAIAEQVHGPREGDHAVVRREVVEFMRANVEDFEPFVENDETFHSYTQRMSTAGTWGSHMEILAAARLFNVNFSIHQVGQPRWELMGAPQHAVFYHLAYEHGEHYNAIRRMSDPSDDAAVPFCITATGLDQHAPACSSEGGAEQAAVDRLLYCTACTDAAYVLQVLRDMEGDEDAAMEALIAAPEPEPSSSPRADVSSGDRGEDSGCVEEAGGTSTATEPPEEEVVEVEVVVQKAERKKSKAVDPTETPKPNGRCTCGSKKKFKACCGTGVKRKAGAPAAVRSDELLVSEAVAALRL